MRILIFSDIHGDTRALERVMAAPADLYISAGDLSTFGRGLDACGEVLQPLGEKLWVIPGNHETAQENAEFCKKFGFVDFHRQVRELESRGGQTTQWAGLGYSNPTPFDTPGEMSEEEIAEALRPFEGISPLYLVVHFPPHDSLLDRVMLGRHAGSRTLRAWVDRVRPAWLFCGHIHECAGKNEKIGETQCVSLGKSGYVVEL
jgi:Icc-related predicted phosphoesterase